MGCGTNSVVINRPSQAAYNNACVSGTKAWVAGCSTNGSCFTTDRKLTARKNREKVREEIGDSVLKKLGAPSVDIELDQQGLDFCIDYALRVFEDYASREYFEYYTFNAVPGRSVYELPDEIGIVRNVFYKTQGMGSFMAQDLGGAIPVEYFGGSAYTSFQGGMLDPVQPIWGRTGEWVLYKMYENTFAHTSSQIGGWEFVGDQRTIKLYPTPARPVKVIVHYLQKCKNWREVTQGMIDGAYAQALIVLGNIRGKYTGLPTVQIDGDRLRDKGYELEKKWEEDLLNRFGEVGYISWG
jgi:hypothetical protein